MNTCPDCGAELRYGRCANKCGWTEDKPTLEAPKCLTCRVRPAEPKHEGKCEECYFCHGFTNAGRCRFRATMWVGASGLCLWHHRTWHDPRTATKFAEFEKFCAILLQQKYCGPWTHWSPAVLWDAMEGRLLTIPPPAWCGLYSCHFAPEPGAGVVTAQDVVRSVSVRL